MKIIYTYYFGELGFFIHIISYLEKFLLDNPDTQIYICTFENFFSILEITFNSKIKLYKSYDIKANRVCHGEGKHQDMILKDGNKTINFISLVKILENMNLQVKNNIKSPYTKSNSTYITLSKPITYIDDNLSTKYNKLDKEIIVFFFRKRSIVNRRNFRKDPKIYVTNTIKYYSNKNNTKYEPIIWGVEGYTLKEFTCISNIKELIYLFNKCFLFISCDSGLLDLAIHCNVKNFTIIKSSLIDWKLYNYKLFDSNNINEPNIYP